jgi:peptide methionine sulfoxide reductase MsrB
VKTRFEAVLATTGFDNSTAATGRRYCIHSTSIDFSGTNAAASKTEGEK